MKKFSSFFASISALALLLSPAFALAETSASVRAGTAVSAPTVTTDTSVGAEVKVSPAVVRGRDKAHKEIDRRVESLNKLVARVQAMRNLSTTDKDAISATLTAQVTALSGLRVKIEGDTDVDTLKADVSSITGSYRIYALIMPQGAIITAADRIVTVAGTLKLISPKFEARIATASTAGNDVTAVRVLLDDYNAKLISAVTGAQGAVNDIVALVPDQGDTAKLKANTETLKGARAKIVLAHKDLQTARKTAEKIRIALKGMKVETTTPTTAQ